MSEEEVIKIKVMLLGESQIGKTSIIQCFVKSNFALSYIRTCGIDLQLKILVINNEIVKLQILNTAGQERFKNLTKNYYHSSDGFIIGYDITSRSSFMNVSTWINEINESAPKDIQKILIGTKCDLKERKMSMEEGEKLAEENGMKFYETSAKSDINVKEAFESITKNIIENREKNNGGNNRNIVIIDKKSEKKKKELHKRKKCSK